MRKVDKKINKSRRKFLRGSLAGGAGAVLIAAAPGVVVATVTNESSDSDIGNGKNNQGYHLTEHIVDYYKTASS